MSKQSGDYNPDREGWTGHKYIVQRVWQGDSTKQVDIGDRRMKWNKQGRMLVNDPAVANAIRQKYGNDVTVTRMRYPDAHDRGHRYIFGGWPEMPWKRSRENGKDADEKEGQDAQEGYAPEGQAHDEWAHDVRNRDGADDGQGEGQAASQV